jgi:hypothetical protein
MATDKDAGASARSEHNSRSEADNRRTAEIREEVGTLFTNFYQASQKTTLFYGNNLGNLIRFNSLLSLRCKSVIMEWISYNQEITKGNVDALNELLTVRNPADLIRIQSDLLRSGAASLFSTGARLSEISSQISNDAINNILTSSNGGRQSSSFPTDILKAPDRIKSIVYIQDDDEDQKGDELMRIISDLAAWTEYKPERTPDIRKGSWEAIIHLILKAGSQEKATNKLNFLERIIFIITSSDYRKALRDGEMTRLLDEQEKRGVELLLKLIGAVQSSRSDKVIHYERFFVAKINGVTYAATLSKFEIKNIQDNPENYKDFARLTSLLPNLSPITSHSHEIISSFIKQEKVTTLRNSGIPSFLRMAGVHPDA